ncbi:FCD domain-containing protein [Oxalobacteraceae bacterium CAVE-383]|nr:FCD domain-containing protein [Oxalobacteraceae bacterium CAVE-383]
MNNDFPSSVTVTELRAHTLTGVVQREIEQMILNGDLAPGERLNEKLLADKLLVSRGPVREACRGLAETGLVQQIPNRGMFVSQLTNADAVEVYDLRAGLTALASSLLCPKLSDAAVVTLEGLVGEMETAAEKADFARFYPLNVEFHDFIVRSTENGRLIKMYRALVKEFHLFRTHGLVQRSALLESNREHREIVEALKARDVATSYEASFRHVGQGKERMLFALNQRQSALPEERETV